MIPVTRSLARNMSLGFAAAGLIAVTWSIAVAQEPSRNFIIHEAPKPIAAIRFEDADGQSRSLTDWRGKVVLLNIWATWCVPCRDEMPALDKLETKLGGKDFEVVAVNIDKGAPEKPASFLKEVGATHLGLYTDPTGKLFSTVKTVGMPTTLVIDRNGK